MPGAGFKKLLKKRPKKDEDSIASFRDDQRPVFFLDSETFKDLKDMELGETFLVEAELFSKGTHESKGDRKSSNSEFRVISINPEPYEPGDTIE